MPTQLSIIIPALNEARSIGATLAALTRVRGSKELIVVDGGSTDRTAQIASECGALVIKSERGRGQQLHAGARAARGKFLLFLHADTIVPLEAARLINEAFARDPHASGGNFNIRFDGEGRAARFLTWLYPRLRSLGLCYGDSGIFVRADIYRELGGFKPFPIFEDLDFVRRLKARGRMIHLKAAVTTSARRFEGRSFALTFARWTLLQILYWLGVHPRHLNKLYSPVRAAKARN